MDKKKSKVSHESCVLEIAKDLKNEGWEVNADLEGWNKPPKMGAVIPDVVAKKQGCLTRICELATPEMFEGNEKNYRDLKHYCADYDFHFYMLKDGKRVEIDPNKLAEGGKNNP